MIPFLKPAVDFAVHVPIKDMYEHWYKCCIATLCCKNGLQVPFVFKEDSHFSLVWGWAFFNISSPQRCLMYYLYVWNLSVPQVLL